ncbi:PQQ-binding-like beta-propeller repeat protein [Gemmata sp. G18]|uniref:PQQ-binding-like beta-propeller repeat protein n=1 Tax=Gemmata palustris TaxID=2822762 RepID=A0ABS5BQN0_9BACT|nr:PQQ-binding-like beta-propeller repeat protein [Gemmata palustris]
MPVQTVSSHKVEGRKVEGQRRKRSRLYDLRPCDLRLLLVLALILAPGLSLRAADWPVWRGPKGDGIVTDAAVPTKWSATENVVWKVEVPGAGHSSPVVSNGHIFLTSFDSSTTDRMLLCFDRKDGKLLWKQSVLSATAEKMHKNNTPASSTPASDGTHVWVTFLDGEKVAVACYSFAGKQLWLKSFGGFTSAHGFCGTPVLFGDLLIVNGDSDGDAFVAALDKKTGETKWKIDRPNRVRSFSVPLFVEVRGKAQVVLAGSKSVAAFEPTTGKQLWIADSTTDKFVATVAFTEGLIFATGTSPNSTLVALDPTGTGNVTKSHTKWSDTKTASYVPSPLAFGKHLFVLSDSGIATLLEAKTGKKLWSERLGSRLHHASPLLINGLIYCLADDGATYILKPDEEYELVTKNTLGEECHATPAVSDGQLFIRSATSLWCIGAKGTAKHP